MQQAGSPASIELINPDVLMPPKGFAHAVVAHSSRVLYLAGQVAADKSGDIQHRNDLVGQFDLTLKNMQTWHGATPATKCDKQGCPWIANVLWFNRARSLCGYDILRTTPIGGR